MSYPRVDAALETCGRHVAGAGPPPEVDVVLAQHVASVGYAEFEGRVRELIGARCSRDTDAAVASFVKVAAVRLVRSIKISELAGALGWFSPEAKGAFSEALDDDPEAAAAWDNILTGRHTLAHEQGATPSLTFRDVKRDIERAKRVVDAFADALEQ